MRQKVVSGKLVASNLVDCYLISTLCIHCLLLICNNFIKKVDHKSLRMT